ncbi:TetR/AcrR family transcriptional regulator [Streptosporangium sp. NPDC006013]|uniref:TetR/AcrR family transcriptional regulator n=1 Tax=Streptosporangium sp. NPDC006013 TaxID=3155596 RepID=UPI0033BA8CC7
MTEGLRERKKRQTRQRIYEVAIGLFVERGFEHVTIAEVAAAAEVSVNTVYNYFQSKFVGGPCVPLPATRRR